MPDRPPIVDFNRPYSPLDALVAQRAYLRAIALDIQQAMHDVDRYQAEAVQDANIAAVWAATLMVCDIARIGLSAGDRRARLLFAALDNATARAGRVMRLFGAAKVPTKDDLLRAVNDDLKRPVRMLGAVTAARGVLSRLKLPTTGGPVAVTVPEEVNLVLDLAMAMAADTVLILQAQGLASRAGTQAAQARGQMRVNLHRVLQKMMLIDAELTRQWDRMQRQVNTA